MCILTAASKFGLCLFLILILYLVFYSKRYNNSVKKPDK